MIDMEINKVLEQMRTITRQVEQPARAELPGQTNFNEIMRDAVGKVNEQSATAGKMVTEFEAGTGTANVAEVMVQMQKASVSFQAMTEVRNKLVDAYHEIMNMPI